MKKFFLFLAILLGLNFLGTSKEPVIKSPDFEVVINKNVPFLVQAPFADWQDPMQQDACEEASMIMIDAWVKNYELPKKDGLDKITKLSRYIDKIYGSSKDSSIEEIKEILGDYFKIEKTQLYYDTNLEEIKGLLKEGKVLIVGVNGQTIGNEHFSGIGPLNHMVVLIGYDEETRNFLAHDPGTRHGKEYRYPYENFVESIRNYKSSAEISDRNEQRKVVLAIAK